MLHVMVDTTELEKLITRLAGDRALMQRGEPGTRMGAIDPTLRALGWDTDNLNEVDPEFEDGSGRKVDYCLRHQGRNLVLIEAKRASADLAPHQEQLLRYAFVLGTRIAALTNGLDWWLYLPMKGDRPFEERRFAHVDFREQSPREAASTLSRFLNRDEVVSGATLTEAEAEFEREERRQQVRAAFPSVWRRLVTDPTDSQGEMLHNLLTEAMQREVGHRPAREEVQQYLLGTLGPERVPADPPRREPTQPRRRRPRETASESTPASHEPNDGQPRTNRRAKSIAAFWLDGERYDVAQWKLMLTGVCNILIGKFGHDEFRERVSSLRTRNRFTVDPRGADARRLDNGDYLDVNLNADNLERLARRVLIAVRGNDNGFRIELAE